MAALLVGYARCSTEQQDLTAQREGLLGLGVDPVEVLSALESSDPDAALAALVRGGVDSEGWSSVHPRSGGPGPASVAELRGIRRELEEAKESLTDLRFRLEAPSTPESPLARVRSFTPIRARGSPDEREPGRNGRRHGSPPRPSVAGPATKELPGPQADPHA